MFLLILGHLLSDPFLNSDTPISGSPQKHQCFPTRMFSTSKRLARSGGKSNSSIKRWTSRSWWKVAQSKTFDDGCILVDPCGSWTKWMGSLWSILWSQSQGQRYRYNLSLIVIYIIYCYQLFPSTKDSIDFFFRRAKSVASHLFGDQTHTWSEHPPILDHKEEQFLCNCLSEQNEPWDDCACNPSQIESKAGFGEVQNNLWFFWSQRTKTNRFYIAKGNRQVFQSLTMVPWNLMKIKPTKMIKNAGITGTFK